VIRDTCTAFYRGAATALDAAFKHAPIANSVVLCENAFWDVTSLDLPVVAFQRLQLCQMDDALLGTDRCTKKTA